MRTACAAVGTLWRYLLYAGSEVNEKARLISLKHSRTCVSVILTYGILPKSHHRRTRRADPRGRPLPCGIPLCALSIIPHCRLVNTFIKLIAKLKTKHFYGIKCTNLRKTKAFSVRFIKNAHCPVFYPAFPYARFQVETACPLYRSDGAFYGEKARRSAAMHAKISERLYGGLS